MAEKITKMIKEMRSYIHDTLEKEERDRVGSECNLMYSMSQSDYDYYKKRRSVDIDCRSINNDIVETFDPYLNESFEAYKKRLCERLSKEVQAGYGPYSSSCNHVLKLIESYEPKMSILDLLRLI